MTQFLFGNKLRSLRLKQKLTQTELANKMNMTQASISQFERGQRMPTVANIKKLALILEIPIDLLYSGNIEKELIIRNLQGLSPATLKKINEIVEIDRKAELKCAC